MTSLYDDLANAISEAMVAQPYDPKSTHQERFQVDHLVELVRTWGEEALVDRSQLRNAFRGTGFDIDLWIREREQEGVYDPEEEPEDPNAP